MADLPVEALKLNCQISTLRAVVENDIQKHHIHAFVMFGEQLQDDLRVWANQLLTLPGYGGSITVGPWKIPPSEWRTAAVEQITANSALHAVSILFRDAYFELFPDRPRITRLTSDESEQTKLIDKYVWENQADFAKRLGWLQAILELIVMRDFLDLAEFELQTLIDALPDVEPQEKAYSPWKKTSDIQKHIGISPTAWQRHRKELGDEIVNHPTSGAQKVKFTRFAAETLHINTTGIQFKVSDDSS